MLQHGCSDARMQRGLIMAWRQIPLHGCTILCKFMLLLYSHIIYLFKTFLFVKKQSISDFARDPCRRARLDINQLSKLFECWPKMEYRISHCSNVNYIPSSFIILCFVTPPHHMKTDFVCRFYCPTISWVISYYSYLTWILEESI